LDKPEISLLDRYNTHEVIVKGVVNKHGYFFIKNIKPGKYYLCGEHKVIPSACTEIHIIGKRLGNSESNTMILFILGGDVKDECRGSSITIETKHNIDKILHSLE
jgi:hypothetical protein